jgi:hypothetical protein
MRCPALGALLPAVENARQDFFETLGLQSNATIARAP